MKNISLQNKNYSSLIYLGVLILLFNIYFYTSNESLSIFDYNDDINTNVFSIFLMVFGSVIAGIVASKLNRSILFWVIVSFLFTPIALIILGTKRVLLNNKLSKIYRKYETEYLIQKNKIRDQLDNEKISDDIYEEKLQELLLKLNKKMNIEFQESENKNNESNLMEENREEFSNVSQNNEVFENCPACGCKLSDTDKECPNCGLNLS